jgi:hypothetical protein
MMTWKEFGKKLLWSNRGASQVLPASTEKNQENIRETGV